TVEQFHLPRGKRIDWRIPAQTRRLDDRRAEQSATFQRFDRRDYHLATDGDMGSYSEQLLLQFGPPIARFGARPSAMYSKTPLTSLVRIHDQFVEPALLKRPHPCGLSGI